MDKKLHDCQSAFIQLATEKFPICLAALKKAIREAHEPTEFLRGRNSHLQAIYGKDFRGCYVFIEGTKVVYVGISRGVLNRVLQHMDAKSANSSNVVFKIMRDFDETLKRHQWNTDKGRQLRQRALDRFHNWNVAWIPLENALELYLFEAFACMEFNTKDYNSFETH